jgi:hypothetical protein
LRLVLLLWLAGCGFEKTTNPDLAMMTTGVDLAGVPSGLRVFTTRASFGGNMGAVPGALGADLHCNTAANGAGIGGTWRAWLSMGNLNAPNRVLGKGPWYRLDGKKAFDNRPTDEPLEPLNLDERVQLLPGHSRVWTGTESGFSGEAIANCLDWSSINTADVGAYGDADSKLGGWTHFDQQPCTDTAHLYCFEQN